MNICLELLLGLPRRLQNPLMVLALTVLSLLPTLAYCQINGGGPNGGGGGGGTPGGSSNQVQINNSGAFGGITNGTSGQVLTSNGASSAPTFQAASGGSPGAPANSLQFNLSNVFTGNSDFTVDSTNGVLILTGPNGGVLGSVTGQPLTLNAGNAITDTTPAVIQLQPGGGVTGAGGGGVAAAGNAVSSGAGGGWQFNGGNAAGTNQGGGAVTFGAGTSTGTATNGIVSFSTHGANRLTLLENGAWNVNGLTGSAGNVLSSNGSTTPPSWGGLSATALPALTGDVTTTAGSAATTITANVVTNAKAAQMAGNTIKCNPTSTTANASDCNPLQATVMQNVGLIAFVSATGNLTLSGLQTVDGVALSVGNIVFVGFQSTASQDGIYIVATGAWTRAPFFPSGMVLAQNCNIAVFVMEGNAQGGHTFQLTTLNSSSVTIGTSTQAWGDVTAVASLAKAGVVKTTVTGGYQVVPALRFENSYTGEDCASFFDSNGSVTDNGNASLITGPCVTSDANGHWLPTNAGSPPSVNVGTLDAAATDQAGTITGLTATTSIVLTFGSAWPNVPHCVANNSTGTAVGYTPATPTSTTTYTFTMAALTGSLTYACF